MPRVRLGTLRGRAPGSTEIIAVPGGRPPRRSVILAMTADGPRAYWNVCRHLPVPLDSGTGRLPEGLGLVCLTHGAVFRPDDGVCVLGPCVGAALEAIPLEHDEAADALHALLPDPP
jgi:nitrite reductase/ring-hydroxylating ferredoxin subunit